MWCKEYLFCAPNKCYETTWCCTKDAKIALKVLCDSFYEHPIMPEKACSNLVNHHTVQQIDELVCATFPNQAYRNWHIFLVLFPLSVCIDLHKKLMKHKKKKKKRRTYPINSLQMPRQALYSHLHLAKAP